MKTVDLADGRGWDGAMTGGSVVLTFADNWELKNRFGYTAGNADTLGLVPDGGAVRVGDLGENHRFDAMHEHNARGAVTGPLTGAVTGRAIGAAEYIQRWGAWEVHKDIDAFTNDLSLAYNFERGSATLGLYNADSSSEDLWALGNFLYEVVQHGGERVNGIECYSQAEDDAGMDKVVADCSWNYDIDAAGDASTTALYIASTFDIAPEVFTVDFGVRWEDHAVDYSVDEGRDGTVDLAIDYGESETSWTLAGNYAFGNMGLFARINSGSKMPNFDDFRDNRMAYAGGNDLIQEVDQYELGWKLAAESFSLYATAFRTEVDPVSYVALTGAGEAVIQTQESSGLEIDALWQPGTSFSLSLNATLQDTEIKSGPNDGNETQRQPSWQLRLSPRIEFGGANVTGILYGTLTAVGERWSEPENVNELDAYEKLDLGLILRVDERFIAQFSADNITDEDALTEGDPRNITAPNGRFIMPRTLEFSIGYEF